MSNSKNPESPTDRSDAMISRRRFLSGTATGAAGVAVLQKTVADITIDPSKQQGAPPAALGERSLFEKTGAQGNIQYSVHDTTTGFTRNYHSCRFALRASSRRDTAD